MRSLNDFWSELGLTGHRAVQTSVNAINLAPLLPQTELLTEASTGDDVVIAVVGPPPFTDVSQFVRGATSLLVNTRVLLIVAGDPLEFLAPETMKKLTKADFNYLAASVLAYSDMRLAIYLERVKPKKALEAKELGSLVSQACAAGFAEALVEAENENHALLRAFGSEVTAAKLRDANAALERELETTKSRMHAGLSRLDHLERSATWRVGDVVVGAGRSPKGALQALPKLYKIWRNRRNTNRQRDATALVGALNGEQILGNYVIYGLENEFLVGLVGSSKDREELAESHSVVCLYPHDLIAKLESARPAMLLITCDAASPNEPWCYLGSPSGLEKERALLRGIERARGLGIPSVFVKFDETAGDWRAIEAAIDSPIQLQNAKKLSTCVNKQIKRWALA